MESGNACALNPSGAFRGQEEAWAFTGCTARIDASLRNDRSLSTLIWRITELRKARQRGEHHPYPHDQQVSHIQ